MVQKSRNLGETGPSGGAGSFTAAKVRRGDIRHAIVVRTTKKVQRPDGMVVKFDDNACALIGKNGEPIGTRINGKSSIPIDHEGSWVAKSPKTYACHVKLLISKCRSRRIGAPR